MFKTENPEDSIVLAMGASIQSELWTLKNLFFRVHLNLERAWDFCSSRCLIAYTIEISSRVLRFELRSLLSGSTFRCFIYKRKRGVKNFHPSSFWITSYPCPDPSLALVVLLELVCQLQQLLLLIIMLKQMQRFVMQNVLLLLGPRYLLQSCLPIHL